MSINQLNRIAKKFDQLKSGKMMELLVKVVMEHADEMAELNRQQLDRGMRADGTHLPPYSVKTYFLKKQAGQQTDPMNLEDTGSFKDKIKPKRFGDKLEMQSDDWKEQLLVERFGEEILGLTDDSLYTFCDLILPDLKNEIDKFLKL